MAVPLHRALHVVAALSIAAAVVAALVPTGTLQALAHAGVWLLASVTVAGGVRLHRPRRRGGWLAIILAGLIGTASQLAWAHHVAAHGAAAGYGRVSDLLQIAAVACLPVAFACFIAARRPGGRRLVLLDLAVATVGLAVIGGPLLSRIAATEGGAATLTSSAVAGTIAAALVIALRDRDLRRNPAMVCMLTGLVLAVAGNALVLVAGAPTGVPRWIELVWLSGLALSSMSALPPSMVELTALGPPRSVRAPVVATAVGHLAVPGLGVLLTATQRIPTTGQVLALCVLMGLLLFRTLTTLQERDSSLVRLEVSEARFRALLEATADGVAVLDDDGQRRPLSPLRDDDARLGPGGRAHPEVLVDGDDLPTWREHLAAVYEGRTPYTRCEVRRRGQPGRHLEMHIADRRTDAQLGGVSIWWRDITDQRRLRATDALTGLPDRSVVVEELQRCAADAGTVVAFIDLDGFKQVNDTHGHLIGDELLRAAAGRLQRVVREGDVAARLGGDEFVVLVRDLPHGDEAELRTRLASTLEQPVQIGGLRLPVRASVGTARGGHARTPAALLSAADAAMYRAKHDRGAVRVAVGDLEVHADRDRPSGGAPERIGAGAGVRSAQP